MSDQSVAESFRDWSKITTAKNSLIKKEKNRKEAKTLFVKKSLFTKRHASLNKTRGNNYVSQICSCVFE